MPTIPTIRNPRNPNWRARLRVAKFKGAPFYVDQQGRSSGRRTVVHEYPKRDIPYAEDMGRHALRYQITGYLIQAPRRYSDTDAGSRYGEMLRDYDLARDELEAALMSKSPGVLVDPYNPRFILPGYSGEGPLLFMCERYTIVEQREKGGFATLEMSFVEGGIPGNMAPTQDTQGAVNNAANAATDAAAQQLDQQQTIVNDPARMFVIDPNLPGVNA